MPVLEDPDHYPEYRAQYQQVQHQRLYRHNDAAGEQKQQYEGGQRDHEDRQPEPVGDGGAAVDERGGRTADLDLVVGDLRADIVHKLFSSGRLPIDRQVDERVTGAGLPALGWRAGHELAMLVTA